MRRYNTTKHNGYNYASVSPSDWKIHMHRLRPKSWSVFVYLEKHGCLWPMNFEHLLMEANRNETLWACLTHGPKGL